MTKSLCRHKHNAKAIEFSSHAAYLTSFGTKRKFSVSACCTKRHLMQMVLHFLRGHLRAIFCKSHLTCDSRVFRISSYFSQLKIKMILEYGRNFSFIKHFVDFFLGGRGLRDNSSFSRNTISVHKLYFEWPSAS